MTHEDREVTTIYRVWLYADDKVERGYPRLYESKIGIPAVQRVARERNEYRERYAPTHQHVHWPVFTVKVEVLQGVWADAKMV